MLRRQETIDKVHSPEKTGGKKHTPTRVAETQTGGRMDGWNDSNGLAYDLRLCTGRGGSGKGEA